MQEWESIMNDVEQLLNIVIGNPDHARLASQVIASKSSFPVVEDFKEFIGLRKAKKVVAAMELSRCFFACDNVEVSDPDDVVRQLGFLKYELQEHFMLVSLDSSNKIINKTVITKGLVNQVPVHPRELFRQAIIDNAVSIIVAHNHPSGSLEPSDEDMGITRVICAAGKIMMIPVLDHLIVGRTGFTSLCRRYPEIFEKTFEKSYEGVK